MAVINCPSCSKKISDKSEACSHCGIPLKGVDPDKLASFEREKKIKQQQSLMTHSFIAMLLFCGGFLFLFWQNAQPGSWQYISAMTSTVIGFILYIVTRVRILLVKRKLK
ncbi:zinc ribbon domain-containing protein [Thalassotalea euphylliae]|uniref:Zinc ribbon domain-containing protein n=1 Tax=Thalassotalea euphylliae TaxID=1655234 RepID=A0A3E0TSS4_9GAMM|nr:zinc ribbon domain-containing protein [Thalassotalea euphylliae]REL27022.1 zinc ribbon domain-containing protein [Thalassotalea euphylliae]